MPNNYACYLPTFYRFACPLFPIRLVKVVRLRVKLIDDLLNDPTIGENLKVVVLMRDPRGFMLSRWKLRWCNQYPHCSSPEVACQDIEEDIVAAHMLKKLYPGN